MTNSIESRADGTLALFIDGDLQFDSSDEHVYHEGLVLPALSVASRRTSGKLKGLIIGGGDGLSARELLKSQRVAHIDLVDYDAEIVSMARKQFRAINKASFEDSRLEVHIEDAWQFVSKLLNDRTTYDIIISDLTVAADVDSARFHSIDWYEMLSAVAGENGVLAVNGVSPDATPMAFWSIFNGMLQAGWHARPYHVTIPSFSAMNYGNDWGFFIAGKTPILANELDECELQKPRNFLIDQARLRQLFLFPKELFELQKRSIPARCGSTVLLRYFNTGKLEAPSGIVSDALNMNTFNLILPAADTGKELLPPELSLAFAEAISMCSNGSATERPQPEAFFSSLLKQFPSLQQNHAPELVANFLEQPLVFLQGIDLRALVERMLQHASSLPSTFVEELKKLAEGLEENAGKLGDFAGEHLSAQQLSSNAIMLLTLVLVVGNLLYPDMVYAKGHGGHGYYGGGWNSYGGTTVDYINRRPKRINVVQPLRPSPNMQIENYGKNRVKGSLPDFEPLALSQRDLIATRAFLIADLAETHEHLSMLTSELRAYENSKSSEVLFGMHMMPKMEAIQRTKESIQNINSKVDSINSQIEAMNNYSETGKDTNRSS